MRDQKFHVILCKPMFKSEDIEIRRGSVWCHTALNTRFWWARIDWEGLWALNLISNMWIIGSAEPEVMYKPSGDHAWFIKADWDSLLSCFQPNAWISSCFNLISNNRSCLSGVLKIGCFCKKKIEYECELRNEGAFTNTDGFCIGLL